MSSLQVHPHSEENEASAIRLWAEEVVRLRGKAEDSLKDEPVHDLRVALRRCRSFAQAFRPLDRAEEWRRWSRIAARLFDGLAGLRDLHVLRGWLRHFGAAEDPVTMTALREVKRREKAAREIANERLADFPAKKWMRLTAVLDERVRFAALPVDSFAWLASQRLAEASSLYHYAMQQTGIEAFHRLRIAVKRLRYVIENFLPAAHAAHGPTLKQLQDLLGEVHDLDVLAGFVDEMAGSMRDSHRQRWRSAIELERLRRIQDAARLCNDGSSMWELLSTSLNQTSPPGRRYAGYLLASHGLAPGSPRLRRETALADSLWRGFSRPGLLGGVPLEGGELLLRAAVHAFEAYGCGASARARKRAARIVTCELDAPPSLQHDERLLLACALRYGKDSLPGEDHVEWRGLAPNWRPQVFLLAGLLRLVRALEEAGGDRISGVRVEELPAVVAVIAEGLREGEFTSGMREDCAVMLEPLLRKTLLVLAGRGD
ncbi:MAG: hypothetical protein GMKNLPBB_01682 [Myxococcota bacterium]|nr:hypothetical protein [Myxococcota bacterium]